MSKVNPVTRAITTAKHKARIDAIKKRLESLLQELKKYYKMRDNSKRSSQRWVLYNKICRGITKQLNRQQEAFERYLAEDESLRQRGFLN